jgi:hypothetical protein
MRGQQAQQLHPGIPRAADNADFDHAGFACSKEKQILSDTALPIAKKTGPEGPVSTN